jgi:hypothetical protein
MCRKCLLAAMLAALGGIAIVVDAAAGPEPQFRGKHTVANANRSVDADDAGPSLSAETIAKLSAVRAEEERRQLLGYCKRLSELSDDLASRYQRGTRLKPEELKNLGSIKKLAKRILTSVGGEESKSSHLDELTVTDAINRLKVAAQNVRKGVTGEGAFVVHLSVITDSIEVIRLAEFLRHSHKH